MSFRFHLLFGASFTDGAGVRTGGRFSVQGPRKEPVCTQTGALNVSRHARFGLSLLSMVAFVRCLCLAFFVKLSKPSPKGNEQFNEPFD